MRRTTSRKAATTTNAATMATAAPDVMTLPAMTACAGVAALSIAGKEWLYRATLRAGERGRSDAIVANAHHHRSDAYASIAALGGIALLDELVTSELIVAGVLIVTGIGLTLRR